MRLDLKDDLDRAVGEGVGGGRLGSSSELSSSRGACGNFGFIKGWSVMHSSPTDEDILFCLLSLAMRPLLDSPGVAGLLVELNESLSASRDGIDSVERDRREDGPNVVSVSKLPLFCSESSGGLNSIPQDCGLDDDIVRLGVALNLESCILRRANENDLRRASASRLDAGSDQGVIANSAVTDEGVDVGS